jgi:chromosome segregation ATPase
MLDNSQTTPPLPDEIAQAVTNARNNVSLLEAESQRLIKLAEGEKANLAKITEEKVSHETAIVSLKKDVEDGVNALATVRSQVVIAEGDLLNAKTSLKNINDEIEAKRASTVLKQQELDKREASVASLEASLNERQIELLKKEGDHELKVEKLRRAIE